MEIPKTIKNIYDDAVTFKKLLSAHEKARCGKREKKNVILMELVYEGKRITVVSHRRFNKILLIKLVCSK